MIRTDLGIATAYAEAVSKGYTGTRDEFGQMFADFGKTAEKVTEDKKAVEQMKLSVEETKNSVDTTAAEFGQNVADKTAEAKAAITEHANTEKESAIAAISEAKDAATGAITEAQTSAMDAIASAKDSATAEITKKGTDTLATIPDDYTELTKDVNSLKEDLFNKITKFYASNQGETHLSDSDNGKIMDMMLYGKSEQFTTIGKNLLKIKDGTRTIRGITTTTKDGVIKLKGTATDTGWALVDVDPFVLDGMCILSSNITDDVKVSVANKSFVTVLVQGESNTLKNAEVSYVCFSVKAGKTYDISNILAQIEKGSVATSYEPYTGGIPSPSPEYPQEIKSVGDSGGVAVKVMGKNLIPTNCGQNTTALRYDAQYNRWAFDALKAVSLANARIIDPETAYYLLSAGTYTITLVSFENVQNVTISAVNADWKTLASVTPDRPSKTFLVDANTIVGCYFVPKDANATGYLQVQLELGTTPTSHEPYTEQFVQLPCTLNAIPVSNGGNVTIGGQQYIADRVVEKDSIFGIERNIREIHTNTKTMNNSDEYPGWNKVEGISDVTYYNVQLQGDSRKVTYISNFTQIPFLQNNKETNNIFYCLKSKIGYSQTELIAKAIDVDMYIRLQDAIFEPLPGDIQAKLRTLVTNYPVTNISITSDQLDGYIVFHYPISMAEGWNYVKQQINDNRDYIYDMDAKTQDIDIQSAEAYVNSEYAVALTELEV